MIRFIMLLLLMTNILSAKKFDGLAKTPPMGWNSWNCFACDGINQKVIMEIADAAVESGMKDAGYEYIIIDDGWQEGRNEDGSIIADRKKFPDGIKFLADYIHDRGLKFGIYSDAGSKTCAGRPGSKGFEYIDAKTYAEWGVDYLKYDWCFTEGQDAEESYKIMSDALYKAGRPVVFSICEWGKNKPWEWAREVGHLWRTTLDIEDRWDGNVWGNQFGWTAILEMQNGLEKYAGPGGWNDPDMLEVGNGNMTTNEYRAHFTMWCMLSAPLIAGNDLRNMTRETKEILTSRNLIAVNQDILGKQGFKVYDEGNFEIWQKPLVNGNIAVCFLNLENKDKLFIVNWQKIGIKDMDGKYAIKDLWKDKNKGTTDSDLEITVPARDVMIFGLNKE
ncbi:MAG: alpha-galactosidase [Candidatus Cloacimonadota bacterium]|nr:MAG: alpha-galactosidase [Candidatus Cloacimonadota bacterium]